MKPGAKKKPNKRVTPRAASFKRLAKTLRIRAANLRRIAKDKSRVDPESYSCLCRATTLRDIAAEFDNEAATLRAQR